jgi:uncharacterized protein (DUF2236 family)
VTAGQRGGYFADDSVIRRMGRESVLMLGGGRALLMQAAHPLVAAGIVEHSDYRRSPWQRLGRTLTALYAVVFGTRDEADRAAVAVRAAHRRVRGRLREPLGVFPAGTRYSASDPELQLWVHATLVDTGLVMYETYVRPLEQAEREAFYEEMGIVAGVFGVPRQVLPERYDDFAAYCEGLLRGGVLCVTQPARQIARTVLTPPVPAPFRPGLAPLVRANVGLLPAALREQYGLRWRRIDDLALDASSRLVRGVLPLVPPPLRAVRRGEQRGAALALLAAVTR